MGKCLEPGDKVVVYYDPLTEKYREGDAKLLERKEEIACEGSRKLVRWRVQFRGETQKLYRSILEPETEEGEEEEKVE